MKVRARLVEGKKLICTKKRMLITIFNIRLVFQWKYLMRTLSKTMDPNNFLIGFWIFQKADKLVLENFMKKEQAKRSNVANKYWFISSLYSHQKPNVFFCWKRFLFLLFSPPDVVEQGPDHSRTRSLFTSKVMTGICTSIRNFRNYLSNFCVHMNYKEDTPFVLQILHTEEEFWCESNYSAYSISPIFVQYTVKPCQHYHIASLKKCTFDLKFGFCPGYLRWLLTQVFAEDGWKMSSVKNGNL